MYSRRLSFRCSIQLIICYSANYHSAKWLSVIFGCIIESIWKTNAWQGFEHSFADSYPSPPGSYKELYLGHTVVFIPQCELSRSFFSEAFLNDDNYTNTHLSKVLEGKVVLRIAGKQLLERRSNAYGVMGSNPTGSRFYLQFHLSICQSILCLLIVKFYQLHELFLLYSRISKCI